MKLLHAYKEQLWFCIVMLAGAAMLLIPAFWNRYPLFNPDLGTYLHSGFKLFFPDDRPITYGLVLRAFSFNGKSMWYVLAVQAIITSWLILLTVRTWLDRQRYLLPSFIVTSILALTTPLGWLTSEIIPDMYTAVFWLCLYLILAGQINRIERLICYVLFFTAMAIHVSHLFIFLPLITLVWLFRKYLADKEYSKAWMQRTKMLALLCALSIPLLAIPAYRTGHAFTMAALLDQGILLPYLQEHCAKQHYNLCKYKEELGTDPNYLLWDGNSPMHKEGGWDAVKPEYKQIIRGTMTEPKYIGMRVAASVRQTGKQLIEFGIGAGNFAAGHGSNVYYAIQASAPEDEQAYLASRQNTEDLIPYTELANKVINTVAAISILCVLVMAVIYWRRLPKNLRAFVVLLLACIILNAWSCGTFSNVIGRYGARMMWLLPFCAMLMMVRLLYRKAVTAPYYPS